MGAPNGVTNDGYPNYDTDENILAYRQEALRRIFYYKETWLGKQLGLQHADVRTSHWWGIATPYPTIFVMATYYIAVYLAVRFVNADRGKKHSVTRRLADSATLRHVISAYNLTLVCLNFYITYQALLAVVRIKMSVWCGLNTSTSSEAMRLASALWWFYCSKMIELADTFFFIMRGKTSHISYLHVYHHGSIVGIGWMLVTFAPVSHSFCVPILNTIVHVVMYLYYFLSALGPRFRWITSICKQNITRMQISQFLIDIVLMTVNVLDRPKCSVGEGDHYQPLTHWQRNVALVTLLYITSILLFFLNFYQKAYTSPKREDRGSSKSSNGTTSTDLKNGSSGKQISNGYDLRARHAVVTETSANAKESH